MKKLIRNTLGFIALLAIVVFTSCEGPAGQDGAAGMNGEVACLVCHSTDAKAEITAAYQSSNHFAGAATLDRGGWSGSCARCHTTEGFQALASSGENYVGFTVDNPKQWGCATCHNIHESFGSEDYALKVGDGDAVALIVDETVSHDFGSSNLCSSCHQARRDHLYRLTDGVAAGTKVMGSHYGTHYGVQANVLLGNIGWEDPAVSYPDSDTKEHLTVAGCIGCHVDGGDTPDHTFTPTVEACQACHTSATNLDYNGTQTYVSDKMDLLFAKLVENGLLELGTDDDGELLKDEAANYDLVEKAEFPEAHVKAAFNYELILHDGSMGIHNPAYLKALLDNSLAVFN